MSTKYKFRDDKENLDKIEWTVYGKIQSITKTDGSQIRYTYDPSGNRVSKLVNPPSGGQGATSYYVRDAQGNNLGLYERNASKILWKEQGLYGSSRLGLFRPEVEIGTNINKDLASKLWSDRVGYQNYELTNHLGNVMAVISDKRTLVEDAYEPEVISATDYYSFGSIQPGRNGSLVEENGVMVWKTDAGMYRYGFNGKENDNEAGTGIQDYGIRIYSERLGRFLSVDPIASIYPELTPYQFASNNPIANIDLDGLEAKLAIAGSGLPLKREGAPAGSTTGYTSQDVGAFKDRAVKLAGFNTVSVHNGKMIFDALKAATAREGSISSIITFAHGNAGGIFLDHDAGFYTANLSKSGKPTSNTDAMAKAVASGDIKFEKDATWIFASCNAGNNNDPVWKDGGSFNIAEYTAKTLGIVTVGSIGYVSPEQVNGKETGRLVTGNYHGSNIKNLQFIKFTPVTTTTVTYEGGLSIYGWVIREGLKKTTTTTIVKQEKLGTVINPTDYVSKK
jgi:RHS repeat-associated protein